MNSSIKNKSNSTFGYWLVSILALGIIALLSWMFFSPDALPGSNSKGNKPDIDQDYFVLEDLNSQQIADTLGNLEVEFGEVIMLKAKETMKYSVLEQTCKVEEKIDDSWFNWDIFKKEKTIVYEGTGYYMVDLSNISEKDISVDASSYSVTISIDDAFLDHVKINTEKSGFTKTENGLLRYGEIKLTVEQQAILIEKAESNMKETLNSSINIHSANESARKALKELFDPIIQSVAPEYGSIIKIK